MSRRWAKKEAAEHRERMMECRMMLNEGNLWSIVLTDDDGVGPSSLESRVPLCPFSVCSVVTFL